MRRLEDALNWDIQNLMFNQEQQIAALKNQVYEEMNRFAELEGTLNEVNAKHAGEMSQKEEDLSCKQEEIFNLNYNFQEKLDEKQASIERMLNTL